MGSRPPLTSQEGNKLQMDIEGENANGSVNRYKARLITKGYAQTHGVDYEETFAWVAKMTTVRTVITLATAKG